MRVIQSFTIEPTLLERVDKNRGTMPRSEWLRKLIERYFEQQDGSKEEAAVHA